jgi:hypothetical protein
MKIVNLKQDQTIPFEELDTGECIYDKANGCHCMKIAKYAETYNAVFLHNGELCFFEPGERVTLVKCELHIL